MHKNLHETLTHHLLKHSPKIKKAKMYHKLKEISALIETSKHLYQAQLFYIHPKISSSLPEHSDCNLTKPLFSKFSKIEAQLSVAKSYLSCKIPSLHSKKDAISQSVEVTLKIFQERETKTSEIFRQNTSFYKMIP